MAFSLFNTAPGPGVTRVTLLLDRSAGSKTDPIEMTVIDRARAANFSIEMTVIDLTQWILHPTVPYQIDCTGSWLHI